MQTLFQKIGHFCLAIFHGVMPNISFLVHENCSHLIVYFCYIAYNVILTFLQGYHAQAISLNALSNAVLRYKLNDTTNVPMISTINHPMPRTLNDTINDQLTKGFEGFAIAVNVIFGMSFLAASFTLFVVRERSVKAKHSQYVSGAFASIFWAACFICDFICFVVPCLGIIVAFSAFDIVAYVADGRFLDIFLLMLLYGWAVLPFMYLVSFIFTVPSTSLVWLTMFNVLSGKSSRVSLTDQQISFLSMH